MGECLSRSPQRPRYGEARCDLRPLVFAERGTPRLTSTAVCRTSARRYLFQNVVVTARGQARTRFRSCTSWRAMIAFAWHCGMRRTEAVHMRGEDVDLDSHLSAFQTTRLVMRQPP